jgi:hypothetical protein
LIAAGSFEASTPSRPMRGPLFKRGDGTQSHRLPAAVDREGQSFTGARTHQELHVREGLDSLAVDGKDQIPGLEAGLLGGAAGPDRLDPGLQDLAAAEIVEACEDGDRQNEVRDRPGRHDGGALGDVLVGEAHGALGRRHLVELGGIRHARGV